MKINSQNNQPNFKGAYAIVNGRCFNLLKQGKEVSSRAIKKSVEVHSLDCFIGSTNMNQFGIYTDRGGVNIKKFRRFNPSRYKHAKFEEYKNEIVSDVFVRFHKVEGAAELKNTPIYVVFTGPEALNEFSFGAVNKNDFIHKVLDYGNIPCKKDAPIIYNVAQKAILDEKMQKLHGLSWKDVSKLNYVLGEACKFTSI